MDTLKKFFKLPLTYVGIVSAIAFQLIFFSVWLTAYDGVSDRMNQLSITIINEDKTGIGNEIENMLNTRLPFEVITKDQLDDALSSMNLRETQMVLHIPTDFSQMVQSTGTARLNYYINQATSTVAKQAMESVARQVSQDINTQIQWKKHAAFTTQLEVQLKSTLPSELLAIQIADSIKNQLSIISAPSVTSQIEKTNNVDGFGASMVPMMIVLASFVGAMIMSMQIHEASCRLIDSSKWAIFFSRQTINIAVSIVLSIITLTLMGLFSLDIKTSVLTAWSLQTLVFFAFLSLSQMWLYLFGKAGMLLNILSLSIQLVTSGVVVPREMLSDFYYLISSLLPATYAADSYFTVIFGGGPLQSNMTILLAMILVTQIVVMIRVFLQSVSVIANKTVCIDNNELS
ncbi:hypothetical protein BHU72_05775 [Desulfuribacillus stibiiarsenatis]|uniref:ABC-2 type transporter transmembrane domain-containing protein n=1 Tax=Desulfuribacillus stibiiarsenatis TaxID=1390249 RepID=A0A1E5L577_9FIRM|nr:ABC transporter permease [Desulfuribacillus stibiiarsenatis]OEH85119.1 hypothetical protein BHU72_05775 [Desulfuribacillus stibiiarsenatis]